MSGTYLSTDSVKEESSERPQHTPDHNVMADYLASLQEPGVPAHELELKVGAVCCLCRNLTVAEGLVKNARVVVQELHAHLVSVSLLKRQRQNGEHRKIYPLTRINFEFQPRWTA